MYMTKSLKFLLFFTASYIMLNLVYQALLYFYTPLPDPFTVAVTKITLTFLPHLSYRTLIDAPGLQVSDTLHAIVNIKEGCNGMAVWMSLLSFIIAFRSNLKAYLIFVPLSFILIQASNILRLFILIRVKINQPQYFDFFHTYAFPAIIYFFAFLLMVSWVKWWVREPHPPENSSSASSGG